MREHQRFVLGPILIVLIVVGLALDQYIDMLQAPVVAGIKLRTADGTFPPGMLLLPIMLLVAILGARELAALLAAKGIVGSRRIMSLSAFIGLALSSLVPSTLKSTDAVAAVSTGAVTVLAAALAFHARHKSVQGVLAAAGASLLAFVYLGLMFGFMLSIRREHAAWTLLWVLLVTKSCDIGAYLVGKSIGKHKLIPWLSPGKTWEGLFGGIAMATGVSILGLIALDNAKVMPWPGWIAAIAAGAIFAVVGQAGDLLESLLKRDAGHKDSGKSVPGFGGVLDLLDSPLLVAPVAYWWLRAVQ